MTPLPSNSLVFKLDGDALIPCNGDAIAFELTGEAAELVDAETVRHAAAAVLHYFQHELKRATVSAAEFSTALQTVLHNLGLTRLNAAAAGEAGPRSQAEVDLRLLVGEGLELVFFQRLREELRRHLGPAPDLVRFHGLRPCVMQLAGARRWSHRCQHLHDRIVDYLRTSLLAEPRSQPCNLVIC
jgi:hypothetical protein